MWGLILKPFIAVRVCQCKTLAGSHGPAQAAIA